VQVINGSPRVVRGWLSGVYRWVVIRQRPCDEKGGYEQLVRDTSECEGTRGTFRPAYARRRRFVVEPWERAAWWKRVCNVGLASEGPGVTSESELPCRYRQDAESQEDAHRKTSCFAVAGECCVFWVVGIGSRRVVTVGARSLGGGNIILPCTTRRAPLQLGSAEASTDAHFGEQSLHPCSQDAP
jgi:hypothetical protein